MFALEDFGITLPSFGNDKKNIPEHSVNKQNKKNPGVPVVTKDLSLMDRAKIIGSKIAEAGNETIMKPLQVSKDVGEELANVFVRPKWKDGIVGIHDPNEKNVSLRDTLNAAQVIAKQYGSGARESGVAKNDLKESNKDSSKEIETKILVPKSKDKPHEVVLRYDLPTNVMGGSLAGGHSSLITGGQKHDFGPRGGGSLASAISKSGGAMSHSYDTENPVFDLNHIQNVVHVSDADKRLIDSKIKIWKKYHPADDNAVDAQKGIYKLGNENCASMNAFIFDGTEIGKTLQLPEAGENTSPSEIQDLLNRFIDPTVSKGQDFYGGSTLSPSEKQSASNKINFSKLIGKTDPVKKKAQKIGTAKNSPNRRPVIEQAFEGPIEPLVF